MSTTGIVILSVVGVLILIGIIVAVTLVVLQKKRKTKIATVKEPSIVIKEEVVDEPSATEIKISLIAAARLDANETDEEFKTRVSKLSQEEFQALGRNEFPVSRSEISKLIVSGKWKDRKAYEDVMIFSYDRNGNVNEHNLALLTRVFKEEDKKKTTKKSTKK